MSICANAVQQSDGTYLLVLDPAVTNPATCAYVVASGSESVYWEIASLTVDQAVTIGSAIWALWGLCWGLKQIARSVFNPINEGNDYE